MLSQLILPFSALATYMVSLRAITTSPIYFIFSSNLDSLLDRNVVFHLYQSTKYLIFPFLKVVLVVYRLQSLS